MHAWPPPPVGTGLRALLDLALPRCCAGCGRPGPPWCPACQVAHRPVPGPWAPTPTPGGLPPTWSALAYEGEVRSALLAWKEEGRVDLTTVWAHVLRQTLSATLRGTPELVDTVGRGDDLLLVPVPSARAGTRRRGRAPVSDLVRSAVRVRPAVTALAVLPVLRTTRRVRDQAGLSAGERAANLRGAMGVRGPDGWRVGGAQVLLVDDVVTSGATLVEGTRALREAGAAGVHGVTLAATRRHSRTPHDAPPGTALPGGGGAV